MRRKSSSQCCYTQVCYNCSISWLVVQVHRLKLVVRTQLLALWAMKLCNRTVCPHVFLCVCFRQSAYHLMTSFILFVSLLTRLKTHLVTAKPCRYITRRICPVPWVIRLGRPPCTIFLNGSPLRGVVQKMNSQFMLLYYRSKVRLRKMRLYLFICVDVLGWMHPVCMGLGLGGDRSAWMSLRH